MCYYCLAESADGGCSDAHLSEVRPPCDYHCCIPRPLRGDFRTPVIPCPSPIILSLQSSCLSNILSLQLSCSPIILSLPTYPCLPARPCNSMRNHLHTNAEHGAPPHDPLLQGSRWQPTTTTLLAWQYRLRRWQGRLRCRGLWLINQTTLALPQKRP